MNNSDAPFKLLLNALQFTDDYWFVHVTRSTWNIYLGRLHSSHEITSHMLCTVSQCSVHLNSKQYWIDASLRSHQLDGLRYILYSRWRECVVVVVQSQSWMLLQSFIFHVFRAKMKMENNIAQWHLDEYCSDEKRGTKIQPAPALSTPSKP